MKNVLKVVVILAVLLIAVPVGAEGGQNIGFEKALDLAMKNNIDLKIARLTLDNSQIDLEKNKLSGDAVTRSDELSLNLDLAKSADTYATAQYNIIYGLISDFIELTKKRQTVEVNEKLLRIKEMDLKKTTDLFAKKSATQSDVKNARSAMDDQSLALKKSKEDLSKLVDSLKSQTGLTGEQQFAELKLNSTEKVALKLNDAITKALAASFDVKDKETRHKLAELELEKGQLEGRPELELKKLSNNKEIAWYRYLQTKENVTSEIKDMFSQLEQNWQTMEIKESDLDVAKKNFQQTSTGYKKGLYTETQYLQSNVQLLNAEKDLVQAKATYILNLAKLYHLVGDNQLVGGGLK